MNIAVVQSLIHVQLFATLWTAAYLVPVLHYLLDFTQTHVLWVSDAIQPSHPLSPPSPPALSLSQHQGLFQWIRTIAHQAPLSLDFCKQGYWTGYSFPSLRNLSDSGIEPESPELQADSLPSESSGKPTLGIYFLPIWGYFYSKHLLIGIVRSKGMNI